MLVMDTKTYEKVTLRPKYARQHLYITKAKKTKTTAKC